MANDRDCENCIHKINGACKVWECEFEPKRGMTKEEAIEIIECGEISNRWGKDGEEVEKMAIEALKQKPSISEDGTLTVNIEDGSKVSRVLVCGDNHFGGLYYPDGASEVLDKIRAEIMDCLKALDEIEKSGLNIYLPNEISGRRLTYQQCLEFIDKYAAEGSGEE